MLDPIQFIYLPEIDIFREKKLLEEAFNEAKTTLNQQGISVKRNSTFGDGFTSLMTGQSQELTSSFEIEWNQYIKAVSNYHPESPLNFWVIYNPNSIFTIVARKILAIPASSAFVERLFSYTGLNEGKLRTFMAADIVEACVLVHNHHAKEMYQILLNNS